jgi:hypothetical protein
MSDLSTLQAEQARLEAELAEAQAALPAHSVRPWQWQRVEDLEDELAEVRRQLEELGRKQGG